MKNSEVRNDSLVREYIRSRNDDDLGYLLSRFTHRIAGDLAEVAQFLSRDRDIDRWLAEANSSEDFFAKIDSVEEAARREDSLREAAHKKEEAAREAREAARKETVPTRSEPAMV